MYSALPVRNSILKTVYGGTSSALDEMRRRWRDNNELTVSSSPPADRYSTLHRSGSGLDPLGPDIKVFGSSDEDDDQYVRPPKVIVNDNLGKKSLGAARKTITIDIPARNDRNRSGKKGLTAVGASSKRVSSPSGEGDGQNPLVIVGKSFGVARNSSKSLRAKRLELSSQGKPKERSQLKKSIGLKRKPVSKDKRDTGKGTPQKSSTEPVPIPEDSSTRFEDELAFENLNQWINNKWFNKIPEKYRVMGVVSDTVPGIDTVSHVKYSDGPDIREVDAPLWSPRVTSPVGDTKKRSSRPPTGKKRSGDKSRKASAVVIGPSPPPPVRSPTGSIHESEHFSPPTDKGNEMDVREKSRGDLAQVDVPDALDPKNLAVSNWVETSLITSADPQQQQMFPMTLADGVPVDDTSPIVHESPGSHHSLELGGDIAGYELWSSKSDFQTFDKHVVIVASGMTDLPGDSIVFPPLASKRHDDSDPFQVITPFQLQTSYKGPPESFAVGDSGDSGYTDVVFDHGQQQQPCFKIGRRHQSSPTGANWTSGTVLQEDNKIPAAHKRPSPKKNLKKKSGDKSPSPSKNRVGVDTAKRKDSGRRSIGSGVKTTAAVGKTVAKKKVSANRAKNVGDVVFTDRFNTKKSVGKAKSKKPAEGKGTRQRLPPASKTAATKKTPKTKPVNPPPPKTNLVSRKARARKPSVPGHIVNRLNERAGNGGSGVVASKKTNEKTTVVSTSSGKTKPQKKNAKMPLKKIKRKKRKKKKLLEPEEGDKSKAAQFRNQFRLFAKFGDRRNTGKNISMTNTIKWLKQAEVINDRRVTVNDVEIFFIHTVYRKKRTLSIVEFLFFLRTLAKEKLLQISSVIESLISCGEPYTSVTDLTIDGILMPDDREGLPSTSWYSRPLYPPNVKVKHSTQTVYKSSPGAQLLRRLKKSQSIAEGNTSVDNDDDDDAGSSTVDMASFSLPVPLRHFPGDEYMAQLSNVSKDQSGQEPVPILSNKLPFAAASAFKPDTVSHSSNHVITKPKKSSTRKKPMVPGKPKNVSATTPAPTKANVSSSKTAAKSKAAPKSLFPQKSAAIKTVRPSPPSPKQPKKSLGDATKKRVGSSRKKKGSSRSKDKKRSILSSPINRAGSGDEPKPNSYLVDTQIYGGRNGVVGGSSGGRIVASSPPSSPGFVTTMYRPITPKKSSGGDKTVTLFGRVRTKKKKRVKTMIEQVQDSSLSED